ncbi:mucin-2-like [Tribolium madens]|uniref:mucin-2-like n=1 Tax=Tribolium madens TaxID=41895 RepID=UPI001CF73FE7|nr:mucin-2-like [Tribolium madens]
MKTCVLFVTILANLSVIYACCNSCNSCHQQCTTVVCVNQCQVSCCNYTTTPCPTTSSTTPTSPTEATTRTQTPTEITPRPERILEEQRRMDMNVTSSNVINNINTMNVNIKINKSIDNNIDNDNTQSPLQTPETRTIIVPKIVPVTVLVPVNTTTPVTPTTTTVKPDKKKCCIIIIPCVSYGCNPYHRTCHGCHGSYGYVPRNPCGVGCYKKETWDREKCHLGQCVSHQVDCSYCGHDFYQTYDGYSRCHGCFYGHW